MVVWPKLTDIFEIVSSASSTVAGTEDAGAVVVAAVVGAFVVDDTVVVEAGVGIVVEVVDIVVESFLGAAVGTEVVRRITGPQVESQFPGNEADRLQLLLASGSSIVASVYPMKSFEVGQFFGHCSSDNLFEDCKDRSFRKFDLFVRNVSSEIFRVFELFKPPRTRTSLYPG